MAVLEVTEFTSYELTPQELVLAGSFTPMNQLLFHNMLSETAASILRLSFAEAQLQDSLTQHKYLTGKLDVLRELLSLTTPQQ